MEVLMNRHFRDFRIFHQLDEKANPSGSPRMKKELDHGKQINQALPRRMESPDSVFSVGPSRHRAALHHVVVADQALPHGHLEDFAEIKSSIVDASAGSEGGNASVDDMALVWLHRYHEAKSKEVKQAHDQFLLAARNKPQHF